MRIAFRSGIVLVVIRHVILFKFYQTVPAAVREAAIVTLRELGAKIPEVREWSVGVDLAGAPQKNYDLAQISGFEDLQALRRYREHPEHVQVRDQLSKISDWVVVDYEM